MATLLFVLLSFSFDSLIYCLIIAGEETRSQIAIECMRPFGSTPLTFEVHFLLFCVVIVVCGVLADKIYRTLSSLVCIYILVVS